MKRLAAWRWADLFCIHSFKNVSSPQVQVTEWEEEIACLRQQLEDQERTMEARMKMCEEEWMSKVEAVEREEREARSQLEELRWRLREGDQINPSSQDCLYHHQILSSSRDFNKIFPIWTKFHCHNLDMK